MSKPIRLRGIPVSPGIAIAASRIVDRQLIRVPRLRIEPAEVDREQKRLEEAVGAARAQLEAVRRAMIDAGGGRGDHSLIIQAHLLMLDDELLITGAARLIEDQLINAEWALSRKIDEVKEMLAGLGDAYLAERSQDVEFVGNRVLRCLLGHVTRIIDDGATEFSSIVIAPFLSPAEAAQMVSGQVLAFATEEGTRTSHTAIMAQALGIPAVLGVERLTERLEAGDTVIVDGIEGVVIIRPDEELIATYSERAARYERAETAMRSTRDQAAVTLDGEAVELLANIELPAEAALAIDYGAGGIGLYRTEFLYLDREAPPSEEEQVATYLSVVRTAAPRMVTFRTFDFGADKMPGAVAVRERNPAMGLRAVRLGFRNRGLFKTQLKALLEAAREGNARIMFPMISGVGELRQAKALLEEARAEMGARAPARVPVGCMIELPSAVLIADLLAREVDFFSIGTNDLIQYSLAIDRGNDHVAYLYSPYHPSILRAIKGVIDAGAEAGIPVSMCGGAAAEPPMVPVLVGMGLASLSMPPSSIPIVKAVIRSMTAVDARAFCRELMAMDTSVDVEEAALRFFNALIVHDPGAA